MPQEKVTIIEKNKLQAIVLDMLETLPFLLKKIPIVVGAILFFLLVIQTITILDFFYLLIVISVAISLLVSSLYLFVIVPEIYKWKKSIDKIIVFPERLVIGENSIKYSKIKNIRQRILPARYGFIYSGTIKIEFMETDEKKKVLFYSHCYKNSHIIISKLNDWRTSEILRQIEEWEKGFNQDSVQVTKLLLENQYLEFDDKNNVLSFFRKQNIGTDVFKKSVSFMDTDKNMINIHLNNIKTIRLEIIGESFGKVMLGIRLVIYGNRREQIELMFEKKKNVKDLVQILLYLNWKKVLQLNINNTTIEKII